LVFGIIIWIITAGENTFKPLKDTVNVFKNK